MALGLRSDRLLTYYILISVRMEYSITNRGITVDFGHVGPNFVLGDGGGVAILLLDSPGFCDYI